MGVEVRGIGFRADQASLDEPERCRSFLFCRGLNGGAYSLDTKTESLS